MEEVSLSRQAAMKGESDKPCKIICDTTFEDIIGIDIRPSIEKAKEAAQYDTPILLDSETGSGKKFIAKAIHNASPRKKGSFIWINCAAIPSELLESELFGYEKGAFCGATRNYPGLIKEADGGTLFLDEIGQSQPSHQSKLLVAIEEKAYFSVGGKVRTSDFRLVCAADSDLRDLVREGKFRKDLFYRIAKCVIEIPPLRERERDIVLLAQHFLDKYSAKMGKHITCISQDALDILLQYDWPGNVRELESVIEVAIMFCKSTTIKKKDIANQIGYFSKLGNGQYPIARKKRKSLSDERIMQTASQCGGNVEEMARCLNVTPEHLHRTITKRKLRASLNKQRAKYQAQHHIVAS